MQSERSTLARGATGGALAATAVVLFFLVVDAIEGSLMETPAFLASVLFGRGEVEATPVLITVYTVLHYAAFVLLGILVAWILERARTPPSLLFGPVVGFLLFDVVFYASLLLSGEDVLRTLGWPTFLAGNLVAGAVLVSYLGRTAVRPPRGWRDVLKEHRTLREGLAAGLIGAVAVAAWFFVLDLALGRLLFTPAALGSALFLGIDEAAAVQVTTATVLGYTIVHVIAFLVVGLLFAVLVGQADEHPPVLMGLVVLFVTFETLAIGLIALVASWLLDVVDWWSIGLANVIAAAAMGAYLWKRHAARALVDRRRPIRGSVPP